MSSFALAAANSASVRAPSRCSLLRRFSSASTVGFGTGRDAGADWNFYLVLSLFRLASISQGVYKRGLDGNVSSPGALDRGTKARELAEKAWALAESAG